jgi:mannitol/fructose-specific phosphotransferase system IIA component (Ntr-type)
MLAADLELASFLELGWPGAVLVLLVILAIRPVGVLASTWRANLGLRERLFVSWIAPRGIVAASMASLFALELSRAGHEEAAVVEPFTFAVIAATVLLQGSTAGLVASLLDVRRPARSGWLIVNARQLGRQLARLLRDHGVATILIDRNAEVVEQARSEGLDVIHADALDAELSGDPRLAGVGRMLCATDNDVINDVVSKRWAHDLGSENTFVWAEICSGQALGQRSNGAADADALSRTGRVNRGLDDGELEIGVVEPSSAPLPPGVRPLLSLRDGSADLVSRQAARQDQRRIVLQWTKPNERDLFQTVAFLEPTPKTLEQAYLRIAELAASQIGDIDVTELVTGIVERERTMSMEIGNGVAIPHAYCAAAKRPFCAVGIARDGIAGPEVGRPPVRVVFLLLSPVNEAEAHLESLATIARWAHDARGIEGLVGAQSREEAMAQLVGFSRADTTRAS